MSSANHNHFRDHRDASQAGRRSYKVFALTLAMVIEIFANLALGLPAQSERINYLDTTSQTASSEGNCKAVCPLPYRIDDFVEPVPKPIIPKPDRA